MLLENPRLCTTNKMLNGWILLNVETMPKILHYLIMWKPLLSNIRFSALFRHLEESDQNGCCVVVYFCLN